jgi:hypothetical protein
MARSGKTIESCTNLNGFTGGHEKFLSGPTVRGFSDTLESSHLVPVRTKPHLVATKSDQHRLPARDQWSRIQSLMDDCSRKLSIAD